MAIIQEKIFDESVKNTKIRRSVLVQRPVNIAPILSGNNSDNFATVSAQGRNFVGNKKVVNIL